MKSEMQREKQVTWKDRAKKECIVMLFYTHLCCTIVKNTVKSATKRLMFRSLSLRQLCKDVNVFLPNSIKFHTSYFIKEKIHS